MKNKENKIDKIKENISFKKMFFFFVIFSFLGCIYEDILYIVKNYINYGEFYFVSRRGFLHLELSPVYGLGVCLLIFIFTRRKFRKIDYFWLGALISGAFEYLFSFIEEVLTGSVSWDYSNAFLNINGRTTIPYMLVWGLMSLLLMSKIYPFVSKKLDKIPVKISNIIYYVALVIISLDMVLSLSASIRMNLRNKGYEALTFYGEFLDKVYDDEKMKQIYKGSMNRK